MNPMDVSEAVRILYMEDDRGLARLFQKRMQRLGYSVDIADDGESGLRQYESAPYQLLVVDHHMPSHSGLEVIRVLASRDTMPPTIMVTGAGDERLAVEALKLGATDYIIKDPEGRYLELLPALIERILHQQRLLTEKLHAEQALRESEERHKELAELLPQFVYEIDNQGRFSFINRSGLELVQFTPEDIAEGLNVGEVWISDGAEDVRDHLERVFQGERLSGRQLWLMRKDGTSLPVVAYSSPITRNGRVIGVRGVAIDITEVKKTQRDLLMAREELERRVAERTAALATSNENLRREIMERTRAEVALMRNNKLLRSISRAQSEYITHQDKSSLFQGILSDMLDLTDSQYGFIGEVLHDDSGVPFLRTPAVAHRGANAAVRSFIEKYGAGELDFTNLETLFGLAIRSGGAVISNDPARETLSGGLPPDHPPLDSFLGLPFFSGETLIGMIGVANRVGGYDQTLISFLEPYLATCGHLVEAYRNDRRRIRAEEALKAGERRYRAVVEDQTELIYRALPDGTLTFANEALCRYCGCGRSGLLEENLFSIFPEKGRRVSSGGEAGFTAENPVFVEEHTTKLDSGEIRWLQWTDRAIFDDQGTLQEIQSVGRDITKQKSAEENLRQSLDMLQQVLNGVTNALSSALEMRDPYTAGHQQRVAHLACIIAADMGVSSDRIAGIRVAGTLHDIGKINVPSEILTKPGRLTDLEFALIKTHSQAGHDILKDIRFPWPVAEIVLQHHERMDGSGYPYGLEGSAILLEARIVAIADVVESMASHRPYRPARGLDEAVEEIWNFRGTRYDPDAVDACMRVVRDQPFSFD
jgi:PAS domain S-box-containing protein/putative nucleotidyltransferase with HDIG domain